MNIILDIQKSTEDQPPSSGWAVETLDRSSEDIIGGCMAITVWASRYLSIAVSFFDSIYV